jgi:guanine nucleotide-binding protein G(i) subunit alpha
VSKDADIPRLRKPTSGIYEARLQPRWGLSLRLFDIVGQPSWIKKRIHSFEAVTSIIFVVNLAAYDKVLSGKPSQNTMMESLMLFDSVVNSPWLRRASIILFLNNVSHFKQKVADSPLSDYFPDYSGDNDVNNAANYILSIFTKANRSNLTLYSHFTESGDAANLGHVYDSVRDTCMQNNLKYL